MSEILKEKIYRYIENEEARYAFLVSGAWGSGKTYYFKNHFFKELESVKKRIPVTISLFGVNRVKDIPYLLLNAYIRERNSKGVSARADMDKGLDFIDQKYGLGRKIPNMDFHDAEEIVFNIIPKDKVLICLDDFERFGQEGNVIELLGFINNLCENLKFKVIIITNEQKECKDKPFTKEDREKAIGETFVYSPNMVEVYDNIINQEEPNFAEFMQRDNIKGLAFPQAHLEKSKDDFLNIRNLLSIINTFKNVFDIYAGETDDVVINKLRFYLAAIVAVTIEYRNGNISFEDKRGIDTFTAVAKLDLDLDDDIESDIVSKIGEETDDEEDSEEIKEKRSSDYKYAKDFYKRYFKCIGLKYVYIEPIFNLVTSGKPINKAELDKSIETQIDFYPTKNEGNEIVAKMLNGVWQYSDNDFKTALTDLLGYVERGELTDYVNYINATILIQGYDGVLGMDSKNIHKKIVDGLYIYAHKAKISPLEYSRVQAISSEVVEECQWVVKLIFTLIKDREEDEKSQAIVSIANEFSQDLKNFSERFSINRGQSPFSSNEAILQELDKRMIKNKMLNLTPKDVIALYNMILDRYGDDRGSGLTAELPFLEAIKDGLTTRNTQSETLTQILTKRFLEPVVYKAIEKLKEKA